MNTDTQFNTKATIYDCDSAIGMVVLYIDLAEAARLCRLLAEDPDAFRVEVTLHKVGVDE